MTTETTNLTSGGLPPRLRGALATAGLSLGPMIGAFVLSGLVLLLMKVNPFDYYGYVFQRGLLSPSGVQATLTRMGPLLLLAASLIVAFRAGLWNLGGDAQFLMGAVFVAAWAPLMVQHLPVWLVLGLSMLISVVIGAIWGLLPAILRAYQGINEIITTLMMNFLGISLSSALVKLVFADPDTTVPQTRTLPVADRLPVLFGSNVSSALLIGLVVILAVHWMMTRTAFGLKLRVVGANPEAATHAGLSVPKLTLAVFAISAGLGGLAGAVAILGQYGNVRADWNPAYAFTIVPLVFLARFNGYAAIGYVFLFSALGIGSESAARRLDVPNYFTLVTMALLLVLLAVTERWAALRRARKGV
ncbi:ABC transporter permease [Sinirhodobacter populi]|uniref:ABC transporter permease n=1 Tax=Paenirhodobacter populi TaxID=2306993 RepID=A0A443KLZ8_9RHOB|nr:ABC transporter permease [Sinirhodobacter populi]RWR33785.1 ABC transporter permease [Sinirhodobacter populi]